MAGALLRIRGYVLLPRGAKLEETVGEEVGDNTERDGGID